MNKEIGNKTRGCPLCRFNRTKITRYLDPDVITREWLEKFKIDIKLDLQGESTIHEHYCPNCFLIFYLPLSLAAPAELYTQLERFPWYYMSSKWEYDAALRYLEKDQRVIEVGCGAGDFITQMKDKGIIAEGIELNPSAVASARSRNLPVRLQDLQSAATQNPSGYDVVCAFQVLEHISQPFEFLSWCCNLLKPGGRLIIAVPNSDSMFKHTFDVLDLPPHHMTKWSRVSLGNLIRQRYV